MPMKVTYCPEDDFNLEKAKARADPEVIRKRIFNAIRKFEEAEKIYADAQTYLIKIQNYLDSAEKEILSIMS